MTKEHKQALRLLKRWFDWNLPGPDVRPKKEYLLMKATFNLLKPRSKR